MIRILLVDDQNLVQQGIKSLLAQDQRFKVIGAVSDGRSAIRQTSLLRPEIVLLDIEMPGMNGISVTKYICRFFPATKVIILSSHEDKKYVVQALVAGAKAYMLKSSLMDDLEQAILAVNNGYSQIESRLLAKVVNSSNMKASAPKSRSSNANEANDNDGNSQAEDNKELSSPNSVYLTSKDVGQKAENEGTNHDGSLKGNLDSPESPSVFANTGFVEQNAAPIHASSSIVSEQKTKIQSDDIPEPLEESPYLPQFSDRVFFSLPPAQINTALVPILTKPRSHSQHGIRFELNRRQRTFQALIIKQYLRKLNNNPVIARSKLKLLAAFRAIMFRCKPIFQKCKSELYKLLAKGDHRDKQRLMQNIGLMLLGGIIVLIFHNL